MANDAEAAESHKGFFKKHWEGYKEFWGERFSILHNYSRFNKRDKPLPSWSESDVEEFIASDPVHGPVLKTAREAAKHSAVGSLVGAVTTAGWAWKYSRSPHGILFMISVLLFFLSVSYDIIGGAVLSLAAGGIFGWTFGQEIANHSLQLYRLDTVAAQTKFMEWWQRKAEG